MVGIDSVKALLMLKLTIDVIAIILSSVTFFVRLCNGYYFFSRNWYVVKRTWELRKKMESKGNTSILYMKGLLVFTVFVLKMYFYRIFITKMNKI